MPKSLKAILTGVKSSKTVPGSTGTDPGVDYDPKPGDEQKFVAIHKTEKHADRVGNGPDLYSGSKVKYSLDTPQNVRMGKKQKESEKDEFVPVKEGYDSYDVDHLKGMHQRYHSDISKLPKNAKYSVSSNIIDKEYDLRKALKKKGVNVERPKHPLVIENKEELKCNMTSEGTYCPVHEMANCKKQKNLREVITKKTSAGEIISDFMKSKDPKFAGKSPEERKRMALGAYYGKHPEKSKKTNEEIEEDNHIFHIEHPSIPGKRKITINAASRNEAANKAAKYVAKNYGSDVKLTHVSKTNEEVEQVDEDLAQPLLGSSDESIEMAKTQLRALANKAMHLVMAMTDDMHVEPWIQAKIAVAKDNVSAVHDYLIYGDHSKPEEEQTSPYDGGIDMSGAPKLTYPNFSVDVNTGRNV